jgi:hypothetical protein
MFKSILLASLLSFVAFQSSASDQNNQSASITNSTLSSFSNFMKSEPKSRDDLFSNEKNIKDWILSENQQIKEIKYSSKPNGKSAKVVLNNGQVLHFVFHQHVKINLLNYQGETYPFVGESFPDWLKRNITVNHSLSTN